MADGFWFVKRLCFSVCKAAVIFRFVKWLCCPQELSALRNGSISDEEVCRDPLHPKQKTLNLEGEMSFPRLLPHPYFPG